MGELAELLGGGGLAPPSVFMIVRKSIVTAPTSGPLSRDHCCGEMHATGDRDIQGLVARFRGAGRRRDNESWMDKEGRSSRTESRESGIEDHRRFRELKTYMPNDFFLRKFDFEAYIQQAEV